MTSEAKEAAGKQAAEWIEENMRVGIGSGSTSAAFIRHLGKRCADGLKIEAVASSEQSRKLAEENGITIKGIEEFTELDITVDGADEIDPQKRMIKGGGGALLREKILASMSREMIVIVDESKLVQHLGHFPLPLELVPFGLNATIHHLETLGYAGELRKNEGELYLTDNGNYIYDIALRSPLKSPIITDLTLRGIPGVVETGLFHGLAGRVIVGYEDGHIEIK